MEDIFSELGKILKEKHLTIATAESLTGGMLASSIVDIAGASSYFKEGFVTYCDNAKMHTLNVPKEVITAHGAISAETARAMASGAASVSGCDVAVSTTGNAGPDCDEGKDAGLVYVGVYVKENVKAFEFHFDGTRSQVREQTVRAAAQKCIELITA